MIKKIKNIIKGWCYKFAGINFELLEQRMNQCKECGEILYITKNTAICKNCGCELSAKTRVESEICPLKKW